MRRAPKTPVVSGTLYRNVAILAVGLAVFMALFGSADPADVPAAQTDRRVMAAASETAASQAEPAAPVDDGEPAELAAEAVPAEAVPAEGAAPPSPLPEGAMQPGAAGRPANPARPTPAQLAHLIEQSRLRAGANPGGD